MASIPLPYFQPDLVRRLCLITVDCDVDLGSALNYQRQLQMQLRGAIDTAREFGWKFRNMVVNMRRTWGWDCSDFIRYFKSDGKLPGICVHWNLFLDETLQHLVALCETVSMVRRSGICDEGDGVHEVSIIPDGHARAWWLFKGSSAYTRT
jgi:hypothetical protein